MSNCLLSGSKILLNNNTYKNIEDILINDKVTVFNLKSLKSTHNLRLLESKKTTQFEGNLTESIIKNIWVNHMNKYYILNDSLKITEEHFIFVKRDVEYYWIEVQNLKLGDYLYKKNGNFEKLTSIDIINDNVEVYSIETNLYYNYFANDYLVHNTSCDSCSEECGGSAPIIKEFAFNTDYYNSNGSTSSTMNTYANNWTTFGSTTDYSTGETTSLSAIDNNYLKDERISFSYGDDADSSIGNDSSSNSYFSSRLRTDGTPPYSARVLLPFFNTNDSIEVWFKISNISTEYYGDRVGIGIIHKLTDNSNPMNLSWTTDYDNKHLNIINATHILSDAKICMRLLGDVSFGSTDDYYTSNGWGDLNSHTDSSVKKGSGVAQVSGHGNGYYRSIDNGTHSNIVSGTYSNGDYIGICVYYNKYIDTQFIQFKKYSSNTLTLFPPNPKPIAQTIQGNNNTKTLSTLNSSSIDDGPWGVFVYDSTDASNKIDFTVVESPGKVKKYIKLYYYRFGSTFNVSYTPSGLSFSIKAGTFVVYFWNTTSNQVMKIGTSLNTQTHTNSTSNYLTTLIEINLPDNTEGKLLFLQYGWNSYKADTAIGKVELLDSDQNIIDTLFQPNSNYTTALSGNDWYKTTRQTISNTSINSTNVSDLEDEFASLATGKTFAEIYEYNNDSTLGWALRKGPTPSGSTITGPSLGQDGNSTSYYMYVETSGYSTNANSSMAYAALSVPITISSEKVTNKIYFKYHRFGSTFDNSLTLNNVTLEQATFNMYFLSKTTHKLHYMGSIEGQTQSYSSQVYLSTSFSLEQPVGTEGYIIFIIYGWQNWPADMAIGSIKHLYEDNAVVSNLYTDDDTASNALNSNAWEKTLRNKFNYSDFSETSKTELQNEIASKMLINQSWTTLTTGTSYENGWQQHKGSVPSGSSYTGPTWSSDNTSTRYYIYNEASTPPSSTQIVISALRVPITFQKK